MDSSNPLQEWRQKSTFNVDQLRNLLLTEEVVSFKESVWETLSKDPLFSEPDRELTLNEKRELTFKRMKRLVEYEFLTDEDLLMCPMKLPAFVGALLPFDTALPISWQLSTEVCDF